MFTGKRASNRLANNFEEQSGIDVPIEQQREARKEQRERSTNATTTEPTKQPITLDELLMALNKY